MNSFDEKLAALCHKNDLPMAYLEFAARWCVPLGQALAMNYKSANRPVQVGINGCQGSGKSTLAAVLVLLLEELHGLRAIALSIDDFYLSRNERIRLSRDVHPLLITRGVPGTHNVPLMATTLESLTRDTTVTVPRFDKATDDPLPEEHLETLRAPFDIVLLEGWCVAIPPQTEEQLKQPVNFLEKNEDPDKRWRRYVNHQLAEFYRPVFNGFDITVMLKAPSFDCVYRWRLEQEQKLARTAGASQENRVMSPEQLRRFIMHYQRLTIHALEVLPQKADYLFELDQERNIIGFAQRL